MNYYISYLIGIFLFISFVTAQSIEDLSDDDKTVIHGDDYYLVFVNNTHGEYKIYSEERYQKRHAPQVFVESLIDKINSLIISNKDTYENPEKLYEIEKSFQFEKRKRTEKGNKKLYGYDGSDLVYPISSIKDRVVLKAYLSEILAQELPSKYEDIIECLPNKINFKFSQHYYDKDEILKETQWEEVTIRENSTFYLSLLSQGKYFTDSMESDYDTNYYYPSSAGKGVDIILLDSSFNFDYSEFSNTDKRTVKCLGIAKEGIITEDIRHGCNISNSFHGELTSVVAGGLTYGVANLANIYGISLVANSIGGVNADNILAAIQYVYDQMIRPHKTIINMSINFNFHERDKKDEFYKVLNKLIDSITEKGGIIVASAGNEGISLDKSIHVMPCESSNVICVGGISNKEYKYQGIDDFTNIYRKINFSNYGENVDLYAPSYVDAKIKNSTTEFNYDNVGTSFSSPIVAGILATIISENDSIKYTKEIALQQLIENGKDLTFILPDETLGILANNGKHSIYSKKGGIKEIPEGFCHGQKTGYPCCKECTVEYEDNNDKYGLDKVSYNKYEWCSVRYSCDEIEKKITTTSTTTITTTTTTATSIIPSQAIDTNECHGHGLEYPCCNTCDIALVDNTGKWGIENDNWCGIKFSCKSDKNECYGQDKGYKCCSHCTIEMDSYEGKWGIENDDWCGIKFSC